MNVERLADEITYIPHLDLGLEFDAQKMLGEFGLIAKDPQAIQPYRTSTPQIAQKIAKAWQGVSLYSPDGSLHADLTENPSDHALTCKPTPAVDAAPYIVSVIRDLGGLVGNVGTRARIMIVQPETSLTWHSHQFDMTGVEKFRPWMVIVHVPIIAPPFFRYSVIPVQDFRLKDHMNERMKIFTANYPVGRAHMFNCIHYHNVFNDDRCMPRISLMLYLDLRNPKTFAIVDRAAANYTGEYIDR